MTNEELIKISDRCWPRPTGGCPMVLVQGAGMQSLGRRREGIPGLCRRHRGLQPGALPPGGCGGDPRAGREKLFHVSNLYHIEPQVRLANSGEHSFADRVFFCNSGAEANEAAIKLARKYSHDHFGPDRTRSSRS